MSKVKFCFDGENYVVTGASSGMGRQIVLELASAGAKVLAIARREDKLRELQLECAGSVFIAPLDVCNSEQMECVVRDFVNEHGKLHGGVHAAGINSFTPLKTYDTGLAKRIMDVSFWAGVELVRLVTKAKYGNKATSTVLFSSVCARSSEKGMFAYAAAKSAVNGCIGSLAKEIAVKGHRINSIMPGWVENSEMTSSLDGFIDQNFLKKNHLLGLAAPDDVSGMVLFLLSDRSRWITGSNVVVDGGFLA